MRRFPGVGGPETPQNRLVSQLNKDNGFQRTCVIILTQAATLSQVGRGEGGRVYEYEKMHIGASHATKNDTQKVQKKQAASNK